MFKLLMTAIINGDKEATKRFLESYPKELLPALCQQVDNRGFSLIHYLARANNVEALRYLRDKVPQALFRESISDRTPFEIAIAANAREAVDYLEVERFGRFQSIPQYEAYQGGKLTSVIDIDDLMEASSPLLTAVAVGNLEAMQVLVSKIDENEFLRENQQYKPYLLKLLDIILENKRLNLLPFIAECLMYADRSTKLNALKNNFYSALSIGYSRSVIEYIEWNFPEPAEIVKTVFPTDDVKLKTDLIIIAAERSCLKILKTLLKELKIDQKARHEFIVELTTKAIATFIGGQRANREYFTVPDVLECVAIACADDFNASPEILAAVLKEPVKSGMWVVVDAFLKRVHPDAKMKALIYKFPEGTLSHVAVENKKSDVLMMLGQFGASYEITNDAGLSVMALARRKAERAAAVRAVHAIELSHQLEKIAPGRAKNLTNKEIVALVKRRSELEAELENLNKPSLEEQLCQSMDSELLQNEFYQNNLYLRISGNLVDGAIPNHAMLNMFINAVNELQRINSTESGKNKSCARGLWKALSVLTRLDSEYFARMVFRALNAEISKQASWTAPMEFDVHLTAFEYGIALEEYELALKSLDNISKQVPKMTNKNILSQVNLPQIVIARIPLIFAEVLTPNVTLEMKKLLRQCSAHNVALRTKVHEELLNEGKVQDLQRFELNEDGYSIQTPVVLLPYITPRSLTPLEIKVILERINAFNVDLQNYLNVLIPEELRRGSHYQRMAIQAAADIVIIYNWWCSVENLLYPNVNNYKELVEDIEALNVVTNFLTVKSALLKLLCKVSDGLSETMKISDPYFSLKKIWTETARELKISDSIIAEIKSVTEFKIEIEIEEVELSVPPINPVITRVINQKDRETTNRLIKSMDREILSTKYEGKFTVADYLAEKLTKSGQIDGLKHLLDAAADAIDLDRLMRTAIDYNYPEIVNLLIAKHGANFDTPFHAKAYRGQWDKEATKPRAANMDKRGIVPLSYAVSGGNAVAVDRLLELTSPRFVAPESLILRCLRARTYHLLARLIPLINYEALVKTTDKIIRLVNETSDNPTDIINQLLLYVPPSDREVCANAFILLAMRGGYAEIMVGLLKSIDNKPKRIKAATQLFRDIATEHNEQREYEVTIAANKRNLGSRATDNSQVQKQEKRLTESKHVNKIIKRTRIIDRLAQLMDADFHDAREDLHEVLRAFYKADFDVGMRDLLLNLSPALVAEAINMQLPRYHLDNEYSLLYMAINDRKSKFWYLFVNFGGDLKARCHVESRQTLEAFVWENHVRREAPLYKHQDLIAEQDLQAFLRLLNRLRLGQLLLQNEVDAVIENIKVSEVKLITLDQCLTEAWNTIIWCTNNRLAKTDFESANRLLKAITKQIPRIKSSDCIRYINFLFASGEYIEALNKFREWKKALCEVTKPSNLFMSRLSSAELTLVFHSAFPALVPKTILQHYMAEMASLSERNIVAEGSLSFVTDEQVSPTLTSLEQLLTCLPTKNVDSKNKKNKNTKKEKLYEYNVSVSNTNIEIFKVDFTCLTIFRLLVQMNFKLADYKPKNKIDEERYDELLRIYYLTAEKILFILKELMCRIPPKEFNEFYKNIIDLASCYSSLSAHKMAEPKKIVKSVSSSSESKQRSFNQDLNKQEKKKPDETDDVQDAQEELVNQDESLLPTPDNYTAQEDDAPESWQKIGSAKSTARVMSKIQLSSPSEVKKQQPTPSKHTSNKQRHQKTSIDSSAKSFPALPPKNNTVKLEPKAGNAVKAKKDSPNLVAEVKLESPIIMTPVVSEAMTQKIIPQEKSPPIVLEETKVAELSADAEPFYLPSRPSTTAVQTAPSASTQMLQPYTTPGLLAIYPIVFFTPAIYQRPVNYPFHVIPQEIVEILRWLESIEREDKNIGNRNDVNGYLTGGAVRDCLLNRALKGDYDICVRFTAENLKKLLHEKYGAANVNKNGKGTKNSWSITTSSGNKVDFGCELDANRDLTINAFEWHPDFVDSNNISTGSLIIDRHNGLTHLKHGWLRLISANPREIYENKPLIFRLIRFEKELGFKFDRLLNVFIRDYQKEIAQIPYKFEDREALLEHYKKLCKVFAPDENHEKYYERISELHEKLKSYQLFDGLLKRGIIKSESIEDPSTNLRKK